MGKKKNPNKQTLMSFLKFPVKKINKTKEVHKQKAREIPTCINPPHCDSYAMETQNI